MKMKKGAFVNSPTGYGKSKHSYRNNAGKPEKSESKKTEHQQKLNLDKGPVSEKDKDLNSGFGDYLRSPEAVEMMKLFVFANTIMLIVTMAWPNLKEQYYMLMHWLHSFQIKHITNKSAKMVGPFMQGMLLLGIIYWYTKGMMSMINDYYRSEFQRKIKDDGVSRETSTYTDVDAMVAQNLLKAQQQQQQQTSQPLESVEETSAKQLKVQNTVLTTSQSMVTATTSIAAPIYTSTSLTICTNESRLQQFRRLLAEDLNICFWVK